MVDEIWDARSEQISAFLMEKGWLSCPYTYANFCNDMRRRELVVDERTLRTKWESMILGGIIRETGKKRGELSFVAFRDLMPSKCRMHLVSLLESDNRAREQAVGVRI